MRTADGSIGVDTVGKMAGRGAYLCRSRDCWETGLGGGRLEHFLKTTITQDNREQLIKFEKTL